MSTLYTLVHSDIPTGRQALRDSHANLERIADYCEQNYVESNDKMAALEETKSYTTQSLASVAYQINTLATNMLQMLDLQATQMAHLESDGNILAHAVNIHKEEVANRAIKTMATKSSITRTQRIVFPSVREASIKYSRKPIDQSRLDDIGHGVKVSCETTSNTVTDNVKESSTTGASDKESRPAPKPLTSTRNSGFPSVDIPPPPPPPPPPTPTTISTTHASSPGVVGSNPSNAPIPPPPPPPPPPLPGQSQPQQPIPSPSTPQSQRLSDSGTEESQYAPSMADLSKRKEQRSSHRAVPPKAVISDTRRISGAEIKEPSSEYTLSDLETLPPPMPDLFSVRQSTSSLAEVELPLPPSPQQRYSSQPGEYDAAPLPAPPVDTNWFPRLSSIHMEKVKATYDYEKREDDELSFKEGDIISVIDTTDANWLSGFLDGVSGFIPRNYVEII